MPHAHQSLFPTPPNPTFGYGVAIKLAHSHRVPCREMGTGDPGVSQQELAVGQGGCARCSPRYSSS